MIKQSAVWLALVALLSGCGGGKQQTVNRSSGPEPDFVTVQHLLVAFQGSVPDSKKVTRSEAEAQTLAIELFHRAKGGEDFDILVEEYTDDSFPGVYQLANKDSDANSDQLIFARSQMAECFGDVAFSLNVGEFGMANYDPKTCKYGWHIILRLE